jgi:hypothetical protein
MVAPHLTGSYSDVARRAGTVLGAVVRIADHDIADTALPGRRTCLAAPLGPVLSLELDGAAAELGLASGEILLAALSRAIARTIGDGVVGVDVVGSGHPVALVCAGVQWASATETVTAVRRMLAGLPRAQWGPALPDSFYTSPAAPDRTHSSSEIAFNDLGEVAAPPTDVPVWTPGLRRALELRVYRLGDLVHLQWWYDAGRFFPSTVEELAEQFPLALIELTSEAVAPV